MLGPRICTYKAALKISLFKSLSRELCCTCGNDTRLVIPPSDKPRGLRANQLRKQTIHVGGKRPNSEPCKWQISMQGKWMRKETLSYCTMKSINLSERSEGLLAGINHTERQIKIQGIRMTVKKAFSSPSVCVFWWSLWNCTHLSLLLPEILSQGCSSCSYGKSKCYFSIFCVGALITFSQWLCLLFVANICCLLPWHVAH